MTLTPAYGRDYKSQKAVKAAWNSNADFIVADMSSPWDGKPANRHSFQTDPLAPPYVMLRYDKLRKIVRVEV